MPPPDENEDLLRVAPSSTDWILVKSASSANAAMEMPVKYCKTCNIWRPPRGHHCRVCDNCIENHDHHCVWLNNCVGRRNYRYFFTFVASGTLMAFYVLGACLAHIIVYMNLDGITFGESINCWRVPFALVIYALLAFPYPLALMGYHIFLMARGETTREYLNSHKFIKSERHRAFTQENIIKNWIIVLCRPRPPTYMHFKRKYEEGDQRFGERRGKKAAPIVKEADEGGPGVEMQKLGNDPMEPGSSGGRRVV
jgi:palmitoyltransferase ZDHHC9/14/18